MYNTFMPLSVPAIIKKHRKQAIILGTLYAVGVIFFMYTNPAELPLLLLIVPFVYIFVVLYLSILFLCRVLQVKSAVFVSIVVSVFGVLLFVLGSLHQLTVRDLIISLALTCLLSWYVIRITSSKSG